MKEGYLAEGFEADWPSEFQHGQHRRENSFKELCEWFLHSLVEMRYIPSHEPEPDSLSEATVGDRVVPTLVESSREQERVESLRESAAVHLEPRCIARQHTDRLSERIGHRYWEQVPLHEQIGL